MKKSLSILLILFLVACRQESTENSTINYTDKGTITTGDTLVEPALGEATSLVPMLAGGAPASAIAAYIYNTLLKYDKNLNIIGDLAKKWIVSDDNLTITFYLKDNIFFTDGTQLTAHDVLATYKIMTDPNTRTPYAGDYILVKKAKVIDKLTFRVTYKKPFSPALSSWVGLQIFPKHILDLEPDFNKTPLKEKPLGTGPYILENWERGKDVVLKVNPNYFDGRANLDQIRIRLIPDQDTQFLELKAGKIDTMKLKPLQYTRLTDTKKFNQTYTKYNYLGFNYTYMGFNLEHPLFQNKKIRQALSYAVPRESIIKSILFGQGVPIAGVFKPGTWAYNADLKPYPYNPTRAKKLLKEAGWHDTDGDGLLDKNGRPFKFTVVTNQGNDTRSKTAQILQQAFRALGIEMKIQIQEWSTFIENTIKPRKFEAYILGWSLTPEPDPFDIWHSSKTAPGEFNMVGFKNAQADTLIEKARSTFNQTERKAYLDKFQEILQEEQPYLWLFAPKSLIAMHKRFKNITPAPAGISYNFKDWYVPTSQQKYKTEVTP